MCETPRWLMTELLEELREREDGGLPADPGISDILAELLSAAYVKGLEDAQ